MDEFTVDAFANRDEPLPLISVTQSDLDASSSEAESRTRKRDKLKRSLSPSRIKEASQDYAAAQLEKSDPGSPGKASLQDRLFSKILQQVIPAEDVDDGDATPDSPVDRRSSKYVSRPAFSLPVMTYNFRRFNARIGIVFVFQNRLIRLFTWRTPTHTLSFLATYTFICLDPYLVVVVPLAVALLFIMVPAFISRHPPPPPQKSLSPTTPYYSTYAGPALAPARTIKPASETSKDFFRNMRDLQNSMADFANAHDVLVSTVAPATNFSNETFSSQLFLFLTIIMCALFISAHLLPWRFIALLGGYGFIISSHPRAQLWLAKMQKRAEREASLALSDPALKHQKYFHGIPLPATPHAIAATCRALGAITLSTVPETREVEIFELQYRPLQPFSQASNAATEWQPHLFTSSPYDPLSPSRIAGDRPKGTRFFEDVLPPDGWEWAGKKWELDLAAGEWVSERLVVGVEYDVLHHDIDSEDTSAAATATAAAAAADDKGNNLQRTISARRGSVNLDFGGWVWDLAPKPGTGANRDDDLWLAYGDYDIAGMTEDKKKRKEKEKREKMHKRGESSKDWEEATRFESRRRTGEWRRRRWVRLVKRRVVGDKP